MAKWWKERARSIDSLSSAVDKGRSLGVASSFIFQF